MKDLVGQWGLYPWLEDIVEKNLVHPDDIQKFRTLRPYGLVFYCEKLEGEFLVLRHKDSSFRVKSNLFEAVQKPAYSIDQKVFIKEKSKTGIVQKREWHYQREECMYFLSIDGRSSSRRYFQDELSPVSAGV